MTRPKKIRFIQEIPDFHYFKPAGLPMRALKEISITSDELEALRLVNIEGLYQEQAAEAMGISRQTLGRILSGVQTRLTEALIEGKAIRIESADYAIPSGKVKLSEHRRRKGHQWRW